MTLGRAIVSALVVLGVGRSVAAQEIRILDPHGLIRAVQPSVEPMTVEITVVAPGSRMLGGATLIQNSGLVDDKTAVGEGGRYVFPVVPPGTWQVQLIEPSERVTSVRIVK